ncbi:rRNA maturation RNase YbeY [Rothia sp. P5764]|uniref:rRNA maturation RNase YbeY n=1 Tax=unclassified Rothia (in: high G+C Gram-positive bacteria) TaxID=2689056 RepID=UPI003AC33FF2
MNLEFEIEELDSSASDFDRESFAAVDIATIEGLVAHVFSSMHLAPDTELSIAVVGESEMERIHLDWMDLPGSTDVMSFPMDELTPGTPEQPSSGVLGDIVLCPPVAARQGADAGHSTLDELCLLTTHGILHCLGYDHATAEEEAEMFGIQRSLLEDFLGRPAPVETRH